VLSVLVSALDIAERPGGEAAYNPFGSSLGSGGVKGLPRTFSTTKVHSPALKTAVKTNRRASSRRSILKLGSFNSVCKVRYRNGPKYVSLTINPSAVREALLESGAHNQIVTIAATNISTPRPVSFTHVT
jgi:hypothetical protein